MSEQIFNEQATAPSAPASGKVTMYAKTDGLLYSKDDAGVETPLAADNPMPISKGGTGQTTATNAFNALDPQTTKGDLITHDGTNSVRQGVGSNGQVLTADSSQTNGIKWATPASVSSTDPFTVFELVDDFPANFEIDGLGTLGWAEESAGTAATTIRKNGISGHPGIITIRPGTVATGRAGIGLGGNGANTMVVGDGEIICTWLIRSASVLSTLEMIVIGLGDTLATVGDQANGIYFQVLSADTNWFIVSSNASTRTRVDTGIAYATNTWIKLKFTINADGTSIQANINGSNVGTAITTNIPTSAISPLAKVDGIAGGTASDTDIDIFKLTKTLTTPR